MSRRRIFSRRGRTRSFRLPLGLLLVAAAIALCVLVPSTPINLSNLMIVDKSLPTPLGTFTPPPQPTKEHIGRIIFTCTRGDYNQLCSVNPTKEHIGRIIFTCTRGDYNQLCSVNADGTDYKQLTKLEAHSYYPVFSPRGGSVVYASNQNGGVFDLFLALLDGSRLIRLTNGIGNVISPSFSPDGSRILFANRAAEGPTSLWTIDTTGQNAKLLYAGPNTIVAADWAPVGGRIAFAMAVDQPDAYEVFIMNEDGTNVRQLTRNLPGIGGSLDWSPDGKHLLIFAGPPGDKNIFLVNVDAETAVPLTNGGNNMACSFSPDGQWIAFNSLRNNDQADIFIMRTDGSDVRQVTTDPEPDWQPQWEP